MMLKLLGEQLTNEHSKPAICVSINRFFVNISVFYRYQCDEHAISIDSLSIMMVNDPSLS
jgi:hypothetical protein